MPLPSDTRVLADIASTTLDTFLDGLVDNVFQSNPLWIRLASRERILLDGGDKIRQPIIYDKLNSNWYSGLDTFDITRRLTKVPLLFNWKQAWTNLTIDGLTMLQNSGAAKVIDLVEAEMDTARLTIADLLGVGLFGDGQGVVTSAKAIDGLLAAIDDGTNYATYGNITRGVDAVGTSIKAIYNATGGAFAYSAVNIQYGNATIQPEKPDILLTTQTLWNRFWDRAQPSQRVPQGPGFDDLARIGFDAINFNGAAVVVDSHVPAGCVFGLNTNYIKLIVHKDRDFHFTGFKIPTNQDVITGQILWAGNLVVTSPRLNFQMVGLT
jgi:hypothetical protein